MLVQVCPRQLWLVQLLFEARGLVARSSARPRGRRRGRTWPRRPARGLPRRRPARPRGAWRRARPPSRRGRARARGSGVRRGPRAARPRAAGGARARLERSSRSSRSRAAASVVALLAGGRLGAALRWRRPRARRRPRPGPRRRRRWRPRPGGPGRARRGRRRRWRRRAASCAAASSVWALGLRPAGAAPSPRRERLDRGALGRRRLAQRARALAGDGALLRGAQLVAGVEQRVDEVALLAHEHVRRP